MYALGRHVLALCSSRGAVCNHIRATGSEACAVGSCCVSHPIHRMHCDVSMPTYRLECADSYQQISQQHCWQQLGVTR